MEIYFFFNEKILGEFPEKDYEIFERLQDGETPRMYKIKPILARVMVDKDNIPIPYDEAFKRLGEIPINQYNKVFEAFTKGSENSAIPKANGNGSTSPSPVKAEESPFPDGSQP